MSRVIWIGYTTLYREGGAQFARVAATLAQDLARQYPHSHIICQAVETKRAFAQALTSIASDQLQQLHFVGHSGMYGMMFGTVALPEQLSPHEWRQLRLPFSNNAEAFFHCCRSARWFAPFFARTFGVPASGYHWYTTVSARRDRYVPSQESSTAPAFIIGMIGRKSHGYAGSILKRSGIAKAEPMTRFESTQLQGDLSYDSVAALYDAAYPDIAVRGPELTWLQSHLPTLASGHTGLRLLDIGCGNGALLQKLAPRLSQGVGVDASAGMLAMAHKRNQHQKLRFEKIAGPHLPVADQSIDVVISLLSFRYLDWDPMMNEIKRVLIPGGKLLIIDMVAAPLDAKSLPGFARSKRQQLKHRLTNRKFATQLDALVRDPRWQTMLKYNPIRAEHEYVWYLQSRFPGRHVEVLDVGYHARTVAFDSGPITSAMIAPQTYP
jgi:ubiquinone/menaquinone biosynthesis C-methylase UbiE